MPKIGKEEVDRVSIYLPIQISKLLRQEADDHNRSINKELVQIIEEYATTLLQKKEKSHD